jgi:protein-S-isoprenylcysteine O-methyltransferase Ste14
MSRITIFFLVVVTLGLSLLLSLLGWFTLPTNLLGWFLLISGLIYFFGIIVVYWIRGIRFWRPRAVGELLKQEPTDRSFRAIVLGMIPAFYLPPLGYLFFEAILPRTRGMQILGLFIIVLGSVLFVWARRALGNFYSGHLSVVEGQPLVQHGPYRLIRHPAYAGYVLIALGLSIGYSSIGGLIIILCLLIPTLIYRIQVEDTVLAKHFGNQFMNYARKTKCLLPYIW